MNDRIFIESEVNERTNPIIRVTIEDDAGSPVLPDTLSLTLTDFLTGEILNDRNGQDVLNLNGVTVTSGLIEWQTDVLDHLIVTLTLPYERRIALFEWTWLDGAVTRHGKQEVEYLVRNLTRVAHTGSPA